MQVAVFFFRQHIASLFSRKCHGLFLHLVYIWTSYCHGIYLHFKFDLQIVVCFNLNLSIFVKQLLSEDHDRGLILWKSKIFFTNFHELKRLGCGLILKILSFFKLFGREGRTACGEWTDHLSCIFHITYVYFVWTSTYPLGKY